MKNKRTNTEPSHRRLMLMRFARNALKPCKRPRVPDRLKNMTDGEPEEADDEEVFN